jgi:hypothetical protein
MELTSTMQAACDQEPGPNVASNGRQPADGGQLLQLPECALRVAAAMLARLELADKKFNVWQELLAGATGARAWGIAQEAYGLAELAINEVADWRIVYRHDIREA